MIVPLASGAADVSSSNGWWYDATGTYHLVVRGDGTCAGCTLTVHLTGQMVTVPLPGTVTLLLTGLLAGLPLVTSRRVTF